MMLNNLLILALSLVAVQCKQPRARRKRRNERKGRTNRLLENERRSKTLLTDPQLKDPRAAMDARTGIQTNKRHTTLGGAVMPEEYPVPKVCRGSSSVVCHLQRCRPCRGYGELEQMKMRDIGEKLTV